MRKNMVRIGAIKSRFPIKIAPQAIKIVAIKAFTGSPRLSSNLKGFKKGMISSLAIACNKRGAETKLCKAAPIVDNRDPITIR